MDQIIQDIFNAIHEGNSGLTKEKVQEGLNSGIDPSKILSTGMIASMAEVGERFEKGVLLYYKTEHREKGGIPQPDGTLAPLMGFSIGVVSDKDGPFYDIHISV